MFLFRFGWALVDVMALPSDCEAEQVGQCGVRFVKNDDSDEPCFQGDNAGFNEIESPI